MNDNAKGPAKSAGAQLRRYGEQALREVRLDLCTLVPPSNITYSQDIRELLMEWADELNDCERIFIRASVSNRRIFMDFDGSPIPKGRLIL